MNFKLKLWSLSLLLLIASISFEAKILAGDRAVTEEDSCMIGKDGKEIEASRKPIHRVTMPLNGSSKYDHLTFFHIGAPESCTACIEIDHPALAVVSLIPHPNFPPAPKVITPVAAKPQVGASAGKDLEQIDRELEEKYINSQKRSKEIIDENRRKQMFEYNLGRLSQAERDREACCKAAAIVGGGILVVTVVKAFAGRS